MPRKLTQAELAAKLKLRAEVAAEELQKRLKLAQVNVAARIEALSERLAAATDARSRNALYAQIEALYDQQAKAYEDWMQDQIAKTAVEWRNKAKKDLKPSATLKTEFDRGLVKRYMEMVHEGNQQFLAGVFTDKMGAADLRQLRSAFVDTLRQQSIEGWTARETHKALQERWDRLAKTLRSDRFVDAAGRPWTNADYISMLTRTTLAKVHREAYVDGIVEEGYELSRIISDGDPCEVCRAWDGIIVDVSGNQRTHYPSLSQAYNAGWGHPNCGCHLEAVIDAIDGKEIERQRKQPAVDWSDPTAVQAYNDKIRIQGKRDEGMSARDAERDLKRDKIRMELQAGLMGKHSEEIDKIPPAVLDRLPMAKIPRFEYAKKGDLTGGRIGMNRKSLRGGVVKIDRYNVDPVEIGRQVRLAVAKTAMDEIEPVKDANGLVVSFKSKIINHWDEPDKNGKVKSSSDLDGRIASIDRALTAIKVGETWKAKGNQRLYLDLEKNGKRGMAVFVSSTTNEVNSWVPVSKYRDVKRLTSLGRED